MSTDSTFAKRKSNSDEERYSHSVELNPYAGDENPLSLHSEATMGRIRCRNKISLKKARVWLRTCNTALEAARAYDEKAIMFCRAKEMTNFPIPEHILAVAEILVAPTPAALAAVFTVINDKIELLNFQPILVKKPTTSSEMSCIV
jgi:hypothetical protein